MAKSNANIISLATGQPEEPKKATRERIMLIETPPKPEWFVKTREHGRTVWYLRFVMTGMLPRRFGPFPSRHTTLLALDAMLDTFECSDELNDRADKYVLNRRFHKRWACITEDELALSAGPLGFQSLAEAVRQAPAK